jgi:lysophospholipase L1-like esterase
MALQIAERTLLYRLTTVGEKTNFRTSGWDYRPWPVVVLWFLWGGVLATKVQAMDGHPSPSASPFAQEVATLEQSVVHGPQHPIVFYGSSSIRLWKSLSQDFPNYPVMNCGFGGSRLTDCVDYAASIVLRLKPAAVVIYAGDNDLAQGKLPEQAFASFEQLFRTLRTYSVQMPIAFIGVKPAPARAQNLDNILKFNRMVQSFLQRQPRSRFIDVCSTMLGPDRKPLLALFASDQIHLSPAGYQIFQRNVSAFLASELPSAPRVDAHP